MGKIIGTAGHVDHGKTELIKALTGIDTDRLQEEKDRGLTIDLGFAYIDLEKSGRTGIIDVPGHEKFLKNMLAGVGGMDIVILVVAANESVMPQTREHFQILRLLRINSIVVGISKIDTVDEETRLIVKEEVNDLIKDTRYADAPVVEFSSVTGEGLDDIKKVLDESVSNIKEKKSENEFSRLAIDRCFDLKGIGSVITGTLLSGSIREGEEIVVVPPGLKTKARQIQEHNEKKKMVTAGERVAINLPGIEKRLVKRGYVISKPDEFTPTGKMLVYVEPILDKEEIKDMSRVRVYFGSGEYLGRLELIGKRKAKGNEKFLSLLALEEEIVALRKDRFILRFYSPMKLLGGGVVLNAFPVVKRRFSKETVSRLKQLVNSEDDETILFFLENNHMPKEELRKSLQIHPESFERLIDGLRRKGKISVLGDELISKQGFEWAKKTVLEKLKDFHNKNPLKKGMDKEVLRNALSFERNAFDSLLSKVDIVKVEKNFISLIGFSPKLDEGTGKRKKEILNSLKKNLFKPEKIEEDDLTRNLVDEGEIVKVKRNMYFHRDAIEKGKQLIGDAIREKGPLSAGELKDVLKATRKYAIPFLEYLDRIKFTIRKDDKRGLV